MPQQNSITSSPRWMSPFESAITLPCSDESRCASSSMFFSTSALKLNITRARRCGLVAAQAGLRGLRGGDRRVEHGLVAERTRAWTAGIGIEDVAEARAVGRDRVGELMGDLAHGGRASPVMIAASLDLCEIALKAKYAHAGPANMHGWGRAGQIRQRRA
jgi:hypothetical protein